MYYPDLTPYSYFRKSIFKKQVNIGWLDGEHEYTRGKTTNEFKDALFSCCLRVCNVMRGCHECELCVDPPENGIEVEKGTQVAYLGNGEIRVKGERGIYYAAPTLIYHYVTEQDYLPPAEFIEAVLTRKHAGQRRLPQLGRRLCSIWRAVCHPRDSGR